MATNKRIQPRFELVVLGEDPAPRQFTTELMKGEVPWTVTTFDYVAGQWTLTGDREICTDPSMEPRSPVEDHDVCAR